MKIGEVAKITGLTIRALRHYDRIGLLKPKEFTEAGYRIYDEADMETLQQILFFRELDFPLNEIKAILSAPDYDKEAIMRRHGELLRQKRERLNGLIALIDNNVKGEKNMSFKEFDNTKINEERKKYAEEVKQRWGKSEQYQQSERKTALYDKEQWQQLDEEGADIIQQFAKIRQLAPDCEQAQQLVARWQSYISDNFYTCTKPILGCLGQMYSQDERFTRNIDRAGEGTANFMAAAIEKYCQ